MPRPNLQTIAFDPDGGPIWVELTFPETILFCSYTLQLREAESSAYVDGYRELQGDNENLQDDNHALPLPVATNAGRVLRVLFTIFNEEEGGGKYTITVTLRQDRDILFEKTYTQPPEPWKEAHEQLIRRLVPR